MPQSITQESITQIGYHFDTLESIDKENNLLDNLLMDALFHQQNSGGESCGNYYLYVRILKELMDIINPNKNPES